MFITCLETRTVKRYVQTCSKEVANTHAKHIWTRILNSDDKIDSGY